MNSRSTFAHQPSNSNDSREQTQAMTFVYGACLGILVVMFLSCRNQSQSKPHPTDLDSLGEPATNSKVAGTSWKFRGGDVPKFHSQPEISYAMIQHLVFSTITFHSQGDFSVQPNESLDAAQNLKVHDGATWTIDDRVTLVAQLTTDTSDGPKKVKWNFRLMGTDSIAWFGPFCTDCGERHSLVLHRSDTTKKVEDK